MKQRKCIRLLTFITLLVFYALSSEASIQCYQCHGTSSPVDYRPLDAAFRNVSSGGFQGNHRTHMAAPASSKACATCHPGSGSYNSSHRNGQIKLSGHINNSPLVTPYNGITSAFSQTSTPALASCNNVNCHFEAITPTWGTDPAATTCGTCHGAPPSDGSHPKHATYYGIDATSCLRCHQNNAGFTHATSVGKRALNVQFTTAPNSNGSYSGTLNYPDYLPSQSPLRNGTCTGLYCHSTGTGGAPTVVPVWGTPLPADCTGCHGGAVDSASVLTSGKHPAHINNAAVLGTNFGCAECHAKSVSGNTTIGTLANHVNGFVDFSGAKAGKSSTYSTSTGVCSATYCHSDGKGTAKSMATDTWKAATTLDCKGCHGSDVAPAFTSSAAGEPNYTNGGPGALRANSHQRHTTAGPTSCDACHTGTNTSGAAINTGSVLHINKTADVTFNTVKVGASATWTAGSKICTSTYCHSNGTSVATGSIPANTTPAWGSGALACNGCHGNPPAFSNGSPKANSHGGIHTFSCNKCHVNTTSDGATITNAANHVNKSYNVDAGAGASFSYTYNAPGGTCSSISCHGTTNAQWGSTSCLGCHSVAQGNRVAVTAQFGANSHHIQGTVTDAKCYQCHWEANSDGTINPTYHGGSSASGATVDLVVYGAGTRPATYTQSGFLGVISNSGDGSWTKGTPIVINNSGNGTILKSYQAKITVTYDSDMKSDFSDLRFFEGTTELSYWIESYTVSASAAVWVKVPLIPASSSKTITMYYGNQSATSSSNARATLIPNSITAQVGNCTDGANCAFMDNHAEANSIRGYPANIGTLNVSNIYWGSVWESSSPGSDVRSMFFSRFRFLFIPDVSGTWQFAVDSDDASELILNPNDRTIPSGEQVISSTYGGQGWSNSQVYAGPMNVTANQGYWLDYLQEEWDGGEAAVLWMQRPGDSWKNFSAQNFANMIFSRKYASPEPTSSIGAEQAVNISNNLGTVTAIQYTANNTRAEIQKISYHCLGCHSDQNNTSQPFGDGKTPRQYAWDGTSVAARYSQTGTTQWDKYNVTPKAGQTKAFSAHGNTVNNQGGWDTSESWPDTRSTSTSVACYDCHNSHGSTVSGTTTSYASATANAGILKDTTAGKGGYSQTYQPASGGSAATKNAYNTGAGLCFDCHLTPDAGTKPWGYSGTFGVIQKISGYWDTDYFGPGTFGSQIRYPFKAAKGHMGGHFGASSTLSSTPTAPIGGICTPCHDPHGVSPTLGSKQQYSVPLLKGTWFTSPYREDTSPAVAGAPGTYPDQTGLRPVPYHIDQNTFGSSLGGTIPASTFRNVSTSSGLCLGCHPRNSLTDGTTHTWKSKDRIHESVNGWKTANGTIKHNYSCSKCHAVHNSRLPRLMVTGCLDSQHKGRSGFNGQARLYGGTSASGPYGSGSGSGRFPGVYSGSGSGGWYYPLYGPAPSPSTISVTCHESPAANNGANSNLDQGWNVKTPWNNAGAPTEVSAMPGNTQITISWTAGTGSSSSLIRYGTATGVYGAPIDPATSPRSVTGLANGQTIYYQVGAKNGGVTTWSAEYIVTPNVPPPATPTGISATSGNGQVTISWTAGAGSSSSLIRYGTSPGVYGATFDPATSPRIIAGTNGQAIYYQVGAKNAVGTTWSNEGSATPAGLPTLASPTATATGSTTATLGANLTFDGGAAVTARGTVWGTSSNPTGNAVAEGGTATGVFSHARTGLTAGTRIYYRGYATNSAGTGYSTNGSFYTEPATQASGVNFTAVGSTGMTINWVRGSSDGVIVLMRQGAAVDSDPVDGTYTGYTASAAFGGGAQIGTGNYVVYKGAGTSAAVTGLTGGTTYHVAVYEYKGAANTSGADQGTNYKPTPVTGSQVTSSPTAPTLTSPTATAIDNSTATLGANLTSTGGAAITVRGTVWGTAASPTGNAVAEGGTTTGVFTHGRTGLSAGTKIFYRGYATNSAGTGYSPAGSFYTEPLTQASGVNFTAVSTTGMTVNWIRGDGDGVIVLMKAGAAVNADPADGTYTGYVANPAFGSGTQIGTGNYAVYKGPLTSVAVTGLNPGTTYHVAVYEYTGTVNTSGVNQGTNYKPTPATGSQMANPGGGSNIFTFNYTGAFESISIPAGATNIQFIVKGAGGGGGRTDESSGDDGLNGHSVVTSYGTSGVTLYVYVGSGGQLNDTSSSGAGSVFGYQSGGAGGNGGDDGDGFYAYGGSSGGGSSAITNSLGTLLVEAMGGAGGKSSDWSGFTGGAGGAGGGVVDYPLTTSSTGGGAGGGADQAGGNGQVIITYD